MFCTYYCHRAILSPLQLQPQPLEELTVEQPPDDVEIEPDEQTDAFTVSVTASTHRPFGSRGFSFHTLGIALVPEAHVTVNKHEFVLPSAAPHQ